MILGIDPGTAATGYGLVERNGDGGVLLRECGVIRTKSSEELAVRLRQIHEGIGEVIGRHSPEVVAVEGVFYGRNVRTTVVLGHTRGAILLAASLEELPVAEYSPAEIKNAVVGSGNATKEQVQFMVKRLLRLKEVPKPKDAADGVAVALCHCYAGALAQAGVRAAAPRGARPEGGSPAGA